MLARQSSLQRVRIRVSILCHPFRHGDNRLCSQNWVLRLTHSQLTDTLRQTVATNDSSIFTLAVNEMKFDVLKGGYGSSQLAIQGDRWLAVQAYRSIGCRLRMMVFPYRFHIILCCGVILAAYLLARKWYAIQTTCTVGLSMNSTY